MTCRVCGRALDEMGTCVCATEPLGSFLRGVLADCVGPAAPERPESEEREECGYCGSEHCGGICQS